MRNILPILSFCSAVLVLASCQQRPGSGISAPTAEAPQFPAKEHPSLVKLRWTQEVEVRTAFRKAVMAHLPRRCPQGPEIFGYERAYQAAEPDSSSYEMVIRIPRNCFDDLYRGLNGDFTAHRLVIAGRTPLSLKPYFNADGGPTLLFKFPAGQQDVRDLEEAANKG